jgi:hypothetical protein
MRDGSARGKYVRVGVLQVSVEGTSPLIGHCEIKNDGLKYATHAGRYSRKNCDIFSYWSRTEINYLQIYTTLNLY